MPDPIRIWLEISHHAAFRVGGWAYVRRNGAEVSGRAGGERQVDAERAALTGLIAALRELEPVRPVQLQTSSALVAAVPARIEAARSGKEAPAENLELWAQAIRALAAGQVRIARVAAGPATPGAFAAGWAEFARDRAKDKGPFTSAIPKPNLAKSGA